MRPYWLMVTKGYGITINDIDWGCPADFEPYDKAHKMQIEEADRFIHLFCGTYIENAVAVAVEHCLAGKKAKLKYIEEPIVEKALKDKKLTEEERIEREIQKAILIEEQWIAVGEASGLKKTKIL